MKKNIKQRVLALTELADSNTVFSKDDSVCEHIREEITRHCDLHPDPLDCPDVLVVYDPEHRQYGLPIRDGENSSARSYMVIFYCPWCGKKLPENLSDKWFEVLKEEYGIDFPFDNPYRKNIPEEFKSDLWWKKRGL